MINNWLMLPREHGAWGLLLQPFLCAAILARRWDWLYLPALALVLTAFLTREPVLVLARQRWRWREARPESAVAWRCLFWQVPLAAALFLPILARVPAGPLLALAGIAAAITAFATWMALRNRQRSVLLQLASSAGLASTGLLAALVGVRGLPAWSWLLCGVLTLHATAAILVVRARLQLRAGGAGSMIRTAWAFQAILAAAAVAFAVAAGLGLGAVVAFSAAACSFELWRLRRRGNVAEPLRRVGLRALAVSLAHSAFTVAALW